MRMPVRIKLVAGFGLIILIMIGMSWMAYNSFLQVGNVNQEALGKMEDVVFAFEKEVDHVVWLSLLADSFILGQAFTGQLNHRECDFGRWYYQTANDPNFLQTPADFRGVFAAIEEPHRRLHESAIEIVAYLEQVDNEEAYNQAIVIYRDSTQNYMVRLRGYLEQLKTIYRREADVAVGAAQTEQETAQQVILMATLFALLLALGATFIINRAISRPIGMVVGFLREIAEQGGDLTQRITVKSKDELGDLAHWFNLFIQKLHDIIYSVSISSETVTAASSEITQGNQDLSQRTEEQASSLEEVSSTIQEISSGLQLSAQNANNADKISKETVAKVQEGDRVVNEMAAAMKDITTGSKEIAEIIGTVNDIAFQTNLLALNAAVEAARAGEQGKGFAVVAAEVRNLAGRAAESAKEIERLIKGSITNVDRGNQLMDQTKSVLHEIITNNTRTGDLVAEIASAIGEQSTSVEEIRSALDELNDVTQQNASLVEQIASSSEQMNAEAEKLDQTVGQFILADKDEQRTQVKRNQSGTAQKNNTSGLKQKQRNVDRFVAASADSNDLDFNTSDFEKF